MKKSQIVLIIALVVLLAGAVMTFTPWKEYANYVLVAGLLLVVIRGSLRIREKEDHQENDQES
jgi:membrane protein implicated in regulation of membrane protease activity